MKFQTIAGELCLDFINTLDNRPVPERRQDMLPSFHALAEWALQAGAVSAAQRSALLLQAEGDSKGSEAVLREAAALRECLHRIVSRLSRNRRPSTEDLRLFNGYLGKAFSHLELQVTQKGLRLDWPQEPPRLDSILGPIVRSASTLFTGSDLRYVRECGVETCGWMFVDRSKNHGRRWCDMKVCGNRVKARKFYRRQSVGAGTRRGSATKAK